MKDEITIAPNQSELEQQFEYINSLIEQHRSSAIAKVNVEALLTNWEVGTIHLPATEDGPLGSKGGQ